MKLLYLALYTVTGTEFKRPQALKALPYVFLLSFARATQWFSNERQPGGQAVFWHNGFADTTVEQLKATQSLEPGTNFAQLFGEAAAESGAHFL